MASSSPSSPEDDSRRRRRSRSRSRSPRRRDGKEDDDNKKSKRARKRSDDESDDSNSRDRHRSRKHKRDSNRRHKSSSSKRHRHRSSDRDRKRSKKKTRRHRDSSSDDSSSHNNSDSDSSSSRSSSSSRRHSKQRKKSHKKSKKSSNNSTADKQAAKSTVQMNEKLLSKLSKRNETLEEREERRAKRRAARITARFGYTADDNPFKDPNLHELFSWKKKEEQQQQQPAKRAGDNEETNKDDNYYGNDAEDSAKNPKSRRDKQEHIFSEIEKVRNRRAARELHLEEMERIRAEESKMKELEHYDEWARKEEAFHLQQQRQRSAIRLVEGREKAVDVLAQNLLLFGARNEDEENAARVKYKEKYSALEELEALEVNLQEPHLLLKDLKLSELEELLVDIDAFRRLEREAASEGGRSDDNLAIQYWDALHEVAVDEVQYLKSGGEAGNHASMIKDIRDMFKGQSMAALVQMKHDIEQKLRGGVTNDSNGVVDTDYWQKVLRQLDLKLAKMELSEIHSKMLVKQLEKLEVKREELRKKAESGETVEDVKADVSPKKLSSAEMAAPLPDGVGSNFGNVEEELGLDDEVDLNAGNQNSQYSMQDKFRPRKPRYFNRVKTGYDWNAYNKTHYDHDNPPPKIVQGYKFNVFYPDLIDRTKTPQYFLEKADTNEFCILRFSAGPPYEDVAFKIINRQWNKSRKRGFRCTFERGVLSLYFNFATHWYRR